MMSRRELIRRGFWVAALSGATVLRADGNYDKTVTDTGLLAYPSARGAGLAPVSGGSGEGIISSQPPSSPGGARGVWPRIQGELFPPPFQTPDQLIAAGTNLAGIAVWMVFSGNPPSQTTQLKEIAQVLAANPNTQPTVYVFWESNNIWNSQPDAQVLRGTNGVRCVNASSGNNVPWFGNPDARRVVLDHHRFWYNTYKVNGFHWDGPTSPICNLRGAGSNSICQWSQPGSPFELTPHPDPAMLINYSANMTTLWNAVNALPNPRNIPNINASETIGQDWWVYPQPISDDFFNPFETAPFVAVNNVNNTSTIAWLKQIADYQTARGRGWTLDIANGNNDSWNKYWYCFHLITSDGLTSAIMAEAGPWNLQRPSWAQNNITVGTPLGRYTQSGSVLTRKFANATVALDLANPPSCSIG